MFPYAGIIQVKLKGLLSAQLDITQAPLTLKIVFNEIFILLFHHGRFNWECQTVYNGKKYGCCESFSEVVDSTIQTVVLLLPGRIEEP